jgi:hypothetical protein
VKTPQLLPGHEKPPAKPLPAGPRPGTKHQVRNGETWESVAKGHHVPVRELIANNCGTDATPEEINWYLHVRVGCDEATHDGMNWRFSNSAKPGEIFIPTPGTVPISSQKPNINTLYGGPKDLGCGGVEWLVEFSLHSKAEGDGWIIQQIDRSYDIRKADGSIADPKLNATKATYWEAWPVRKGATITSNRYDATADGRTYDDAFDQPSRPGLRGLFKVNSVVKFYEVRTLPKTFITQNPQTRAEDRPSTTVRPDFWDGTGTTRSLTVSWDCSDPNNSPSTKISALWWRGS